MIISYNGLSCFKMSTKSADGHEYVLITDPFDSKTTGINSNKLKADIVISSLDSPLHNDFSSVKPSGDKDLINIDSPGEYEIFDVFVQGNKSSNNFVYYIEIERIKIGFLGSQTDTKLSQSQLELLDNVDVLILPVGGGSVLNAKQASELVNDLEPRIVIPCFYKTAGIKIKEVADGPDVFFKELGISPEEQEDKIKITQSDLPQEELKVAQLKF